MDNKMNPTVDTLGRPLRDLRISVTDRCNFRCSYCMPAEIFGPDYAYLPKKAVLSYEEISMIAQSFVTLGVKKIRITGGEPLLRRDLETLIHKLVNEVGVEDISLTTNGILLPKLSGKLKAAGLHRVNVSLDSLDPERFAKMNGGRGKPDQVIAGIDAALEAGLSIKVNMVAQLGTNEEDILPMVDYFKKRAITLRFIEYMDVGESNRWKLDQVVPAKQILEKIGSKHEFEAIDPSYKGEVASRYRFLDTDCEFGIITSISKPFCGDCNRVRLSAEGKLYTCLFATTGTDLKSKVRSGATQNELTDFVSKIWITRSDKYSEDRSQGKQLSSKGKVEMSYIGG